MATAAERLSDGASEEKKIGNERVEDERHTIENLPDPDAGLSDEERAIQVRLLASPVPFKRDMALLTHTSGPQTPLETRSQAHPLALLPVPDFLSRPHQHRQRESRRPAGRSQNDQWAIQCQSDDLFRQLLGLRASDKRAVEEDAAEHILAVDYGALVSRYSAVRGLITDAGW